MNNKKQLPTAEQQKDSKTVAKNPEVKQTLQSEANPELSSYSVSAPPPETPAEHNTIAPGEAPKPKPIQERIDRFYELERLMERRIALVDSLNKLGGFIVSPTGSAHLKLTDDRNNSFGIAHPIVIGEMVHLAKEKLQMELSAIEGQIIL